MQTLLYKIADSSLLEIYGSTRTRTSRCTTAPSTWSPSSPSKLSEAEAGDKLMERVLRDAHCHQAAMWPVVTMLCEDQARAHALRARLFAHTPRLALAGHTLEVGPQEGYTLVRASGTCLSSPPCAF